MKICGLMQRSSGGTGEFTPRKTHAGTHPPNSQVALGTTTETVVGWDVEAPSMLETLSVERRQQPDETVP